MCRREIRAAGYVSPGGTAPSECESVQIETTALANALARYHQPRADEQESGFEVPALPPAPAKAPPGPPPSGAATP